MQFISTDAIEAAQTRNAGYAMEQGDPVIVNGSIAYMRDPLVVGVALARKGTDSFVAWFRQGNDARTLPPIILPGSETPGREPLDSCSRSIAKLRDLLVGRRDLQPNAVFIEAGGAGGRLMQMLQQCYIPNVYTIELSEPVPRQETTPRAGDRRTDLWQKGCDWLRDSGAIPAREDLRWELEETLTSAHVDDQGRAWLESRDALHARGLPLPNCAEALFLTFALAVGPRTVYTSNDQNQALRDYVPHKLRE